uniref:Peroxidase n=1 Tax=Aegilops tauschii TaxID=37682 RepID=N1QX34_AEGTA
MAKPASGYIYLHAMQAIKSASTVKLGLLQQAVVLILCLAAAASAQLSTTFYDKSCPLALEKIQNGVATAVKNDRRMAASLLRMHFHDCFVQASFSHTQDVAGLDLFCFGFVHLLNT